MLISDFNEIGNRLRKYRKDHGYTQEDAANKSNLTLRAYSNIERGLTNMRVDTLINICRALNILPNDLLVDEKAALNTKEVVKRIDSCSDVARQRVLSVIDIMTK